MEVDADQSHGLNGKPWYAVGSPWMVALAFSLNSALNAVMCINFSVSTKLTQDVLRVGEPAVAWMYTTVMLTVCLGLPMSFLFVVKFEAAGLWSSVVCNVLSAWIRWWGVKWSSYSLCLFSVMLNGIAASLFFALPAQLSQQRFPAKLWVLTTSLMVQANYSGWMLGCILVPLLVRDASDTESFMLWQAVASLGVLAFFAHFYRPLPREQASQELQCRQRTAYDCFQDAEDVSEESSSTSNQSEDGASAVRENGDVTLGGHGPSRPAIAHSVHGPPEAKFELTEMLALLRMCPSFCCQVLAYGVMGGVGFALPGANDAILETHGFSSQDTLWFNVLFIASGVISGLLLGSLCMRPAGYRRVLLVIFGAGVGALTGLAVLMSGSHEASGLLHGIFLFLIAVVGVASIGFLGLGIETAALYPNGGSYGCFLIYLMIQVAGAVLNQVGSTANGFIVMAAAGWLALVLLLAGNPRYWREKPAQPGDATIGATC
ncbi:unnamed protein product [Polarella glacialis]|uniref:Uncharacterized protein n=1 Tax=Polarella glacialis TaxID=89957 RepID=A0A813FFS6_POLGL|nr:unnamed protein product [Polarella glacialis]CAE8743324.1 unnamed protein product [Polarella glacialis]